MIRPAVLAFLVAGALFLTPSVVADTESSAAATNALALLAKADFDGAMKAYAAAAKADPENQDYRQQYAMLRRVIKMRDTLAEEKNSEKWTATAQALRSYYYEHEIYSEALALDKQVHARENSAESALMLAESQLELNRNAEAADLLAALPEAQATLQTRTLLAIALARQAKLDEAKAIAAACEVPNDAGPGILFDAARLRALLGDAAGAMSLLTRCFESTPPSRLTAFKDYAKECKDLTTVVAQADFAKVLETPSKVKESSCSSGASCGSCPSRASCSSKSSHGGEKK